MILLAGLSADAPGSIRPVPAAPTARLWARRRRIFDEILCWDCDYLLEKNAPGISNDHDGHSYLVLTEAPEPPEVTAGWMVEMARLDESFQFDQRGGRWVRLVRVIGTAETPWGPVLDGEFQVDRA